MKENKRVLKWNKVYKNVEVEIKRNFNENTLTAYPRMDVASTLKFIHSFLKRVKNFWEFFWRHFDVIVKMNVCTPNIAVHPN